VIDPVRLFPDDILLIDMELEAGMMLKAAAVVLEYRIALVFRLTTDRDRDPVGP
jgi:hypothetical protein